MLLCLNALVLVLLQPALSGPLPLPPRSRGGCPGCRGRVTTTQGQPPANATSLAVGAPCGVYSQGCARGLRCAPPQSEARPLRALLEGRGICTNTSDASGPELVHTPDPAAKEDPDKAPCRKLLTSLIHGLDAHLFTSNHDIYMPNCDRRGYFRKKQCWSSRGKQRGKCWCVDERGMPLSTDGRGRGSPSC